MIIFHKAADLKDYLKQIEHLKLGFVPTMGALHNGHLKLIKAAKAQSEVVIASIFVNPTQFNNPDDLEKYPRTEAEDIKLLTLSDCDILYLPEVSDIYPNGTQLKEEYELGHLTTILEGAFRPGHFQGVAQIVDNLLNIIRPHWLFLGQKDLQQIYVITKMTSIKYPDLEIIIVPTEREPDGLAMSSRNRRLNIAERARAPLIYQCLISIKTKNGLSQFSIVQKECKHLLEEKGFKVEYIALIDLGTFNLIENYDPNRKMAAAIAVQNGAVRLIDNILL